MVSVAWTRVEWSCVCTSVHMYVKKGWGANFKMLKFFFLTQTSQLWDLKSHAVSFSEPAFLHYYKGCFICHLEAICVWMLVFSFTLHPMAFSPLPKCPASHRIEGMCKEPAALRRVFPRLPGPVCCPPASLALQTLLSSDYLLVSWWHCASYKEIGRLGDSGKVLTFSKKDFFLCSF